MTSSVDKKAEDFIIRALIDGEDPASINERLRLEGLQRMHLGDSFSDYQRAYGDEDFIRTSSKERE